MLTQTVSVSKTGALILARLLTPPARLSPATLRKNLDPFFRGRDPQAWQALFDETLAGLERDGLVTSRPLALTEAGRAQALDFLGLDSLPEGATWPQIKSKHLVAAALGVARTDEAGRASISKADGLRVAIIRTTHQLPAVDTMPAALDALVRKALDMEPTEKITLGALKARVLGRFFKLLAQPDLKEFKAQLPVDAVKAARNTTEELRAGVLRNWLKEEVAGAPLDAVAPLGAGGEAPATAADASPVEKAGPPPGEFDAAAFAEGVRAAARAAATGRVGGDRVFISHVWRRLQADNAFPNMTEAEFKRRLGEANRRGLLGLGRADGIEGLDPADLRESETPEQDAVFHLIEA
jgi:hypothetical protein